MEKINMDLISQILSLQCMRIFVGKRGGAGKSCLFVFVLQ